MKVKFKVVYTGYATIEVDDKTAQKIMDGDTDALDVVEYDALVSVDDGISEGQLKADVEYGMYDEEDKIVFEGEKYKR